MAPIPTRIPTRIIVQEQGQERVVELQGDTTSLGRSPRNDVVLDNLSASRFHCEIRRMADGGHELVDLGSRNGTLVNGQGVERRRLEAGDRIEIGATHIYYRERSDAREIDTTVLRATAAAPPQSDAQGDRERLLGVLEINKLLNSQLDLDGILQTIMDRAIALLGAERGFLILVEGDRVHIKAARNIDRESIRQPQGKFSHSIAQLVLTQGEPVLTSDAQQDERLEGFGTVKNLRLRSVLCVPFKVQGRVLGVIYLDNRFEKDAFTQADLELLSLLGDQAAVVIQREQWKEAERERREAEARPRPSAPGPAPSPREPVGETEWATALARLSFRPEGIVTRSASMLDIFRLLDRVIPTTVPVLIEGASGTGKELIAQLIHGQGPRRGQALVRENCGAIPRHLMESEFFGHVKGAFTGAVSDKRGLFELADGGTLFLDEIGELESELQTKFLRVLEEGEIRPVGGSRPRKVDVRIVAATNRDLAERVREGRFREDLYYRINVVSLRLPPLCDRTEDIPLLLAHFLAHFGGQAQSFTPAALALLKQHPWPGNIRELSNEVERLVALGEPMIDVPQLSPRLQTGSPPGDEAQALLAIESGLGLKEALAAITDQIERRIVEAVLKRTGWVKTKAAERLGVSRPTLDAKLEKYQLKRGTS